MTSFLFSNFYQTTLSAPAATGATTLSVASTTDAPASIPAGQEWALVLQSASTPSVREVVYVTAITGSSFTVTRGQEGTSALAWNTGDNLYASNTAGQMAAMGQLVATQTWTGINTFTAAVPAPPATTTGELATLAQVFASRALALTANRTISASDAGAIYDVTAPSVTVTLPLASSLTNQTGGIIASYACTLTLTSGTALEGGSLEGLTSLVLAAGDFIYWQAGSTNWRVLSSNRASAPSSAGRFSALVGQVTSNTQMTWTAALASLANAQGYVQQLAGVNVTCATGTVGANGYDGNGALGVSQWLYFFIIYDATSATTAALCSHSTTAPVLPSGYTYFVRVGAVWLDASGYLMRVLQRGNRAQWQVTAGTNTAGMPIMVTSPQGSLAIPTWVAVAWGDYAPPSAAAIVLSANSGYSANSSVMVAPNPNYGAYNSLTNPPPIMSGIGNNAANEAMLAYLIPESSNIYVAMQGNSVLASFGWEDNL